MFCLGSGYLLASCSQDTYIRLWRLFREGPDTVSEAGELKLTENSFTLVETDREQRKYIITLESVLVGENLQQVSCDSVCAPAGK